MVERVKQCVAVSDRPNAAVIAFGHKAFARLVLHEKGIDAIAVGEALHDGVTR